MSENTKYKILRARKCFPFPANWNYVSETSDVIEKIHGIRIEEVWMSWQDGMITAFYKDEEWNRVGNFVANKIKDEPNYLLGIYEKQKVVGENAIIFSRSVIAQDLSKLNSEELIAIYRKLKKTWIEYDQINVYPWFVGGDYFQDIVLGEFNKKYSLNESEIQDLLTPEKPSFSHEEEVLLYSAALNYITDKEKVENDAQKISDRFYWIPFGYDGPIQNTKEKYVSEIIELSKKGAEQISSKLSSLHSLSIRISDRHKEIFKKYDIDSVDAELIKRVHVLADMTDYRKEVTFQIHVATYKVGIEVAKKSGFSDEHALRFLDIEETIELSAEELEKRISERKQGAVLATCKSVTDVITGQDAVLLREKLTSTDRRGLLKGQVASRGGVQSVKGVVKVIMFSTDIDKLLPGEVLVTAMTTPEYVPAMRKACAILTDEGGVTCHAAIVSREIGIPAVIAIGNATKVLKDGDVVEINTKTGEIKVAN